MKTAARTTATTTTALALAAVLTACGGGTSSDGGGSRTDVTATGTITGFGSIYVNGMRYRTDGADIELEDYGPGQQSDLKLGMKVRVIGERGGDQGQAQRVVYDDDLRGPVTAVSPDAENPAIGTFTVLGQMVTVDADTVISRRIGDNNGDGSVDINDLAAASTPPVVAVSGYLQDGGLLATRVDRAGGRFAGADDDDEFELTGIVDAFDGTELVVNGTAFAVTSATEFDDDLPRDDRLLGRLVEVEAYDEDGTLTAREVNDEDDFGDDRAGEFEIKGILQSVDTGVAPNVVVISGRRIEVDDAGGLADLIGRQVELEGRFNADGLLVLRRAHPELEDIIKTEDRVTGVGAESFTTRLGLEIRPTGRSRVEDDDDDDGDRLTPAEFLNRLQIGDAVEAKGYPGSGGPVWTRIERDDDDDDCSLQGRVESVNAEKYSFVIFGVTINRAATGVDFEWDDNDISRDEFFSRLQVGDVVNADADDDNAATNCQPKLMYADEVEFDPPEYDDDYSDDNDDDGDDGGDDGNADDDRDD